MTSFREQAVFSGHLPTPMAAFNYQLEGNKLIVCMDLVEAILSMTGKDSVEESGACASKEAAAQMVKDCKWWENVWLSIFFYTTTTTTTNRLDS